MSKIVKVNHPEHGDITTIGYSNNTERKLLARKNKGFAKANVNSEFWKDQPKWMAIAASIKGFEILIKTDGCWNAVSYNEADRKYEWASPSYPDDVCALLAYAMTKNSVHRFVNILRKIKKTSYSYNSGRLPIVGDDIIMNGPFDIPAATEFADANPEFRTAMLNMDL